MAKLLFLITFLIFTIKADAQNERPEKIKRTPAHMANDCMKPIFKLEDAADFCDSAELVNNMVSIKIFIRQIRSSWNDFKLRGASCECLEKFKDNFSEFSPEDDIKDALRSTDLGEIQKLVKRIENHIDYAWSFFSGLSSDCN